jgi:hypothetical protein
MPTKSHIIRDVEHCGKKLFSSKRYTEIHIQRRSFDNKKGISKIVVLNIQTVSTYFGASSIY